MKKTFLRALSLLLCIVMCIGVLASCAEDTPQEGDGSEASGKATISLDRTTLNLALDDAPVTLVATLSEGEGTFTWESSDPAVATVDANGKVTPVAKGKATITVKCGDLTPATCSVTVGERKNLPSFKEDPTGEGVVKAIKKGETLQIDGTVMYGGGVVDTAVTYSSSNDEIATVSDTGLVTAVGFGTVEITATATYNGTTITMIVEISVSGDASFEAVGEENVTLTTLTIGEQLSACELAVKCLSGENDITADQEIAWTVAEGGDKIVSLSATSGAAVTVTGIGVGETTVTATTTVDGEKHMVVFSITVGKTEIICYPENNKYTIDLSALKGITEIVLGETEIAFTQSDAGMVEIEKSALPAGTHELVIYTEDGKYDLKIVVKSENVEIEAMESKLTNGSFVLDLAVLDIPEGIEIVSVKINSKELISKLAGTVLTFTKADIGYGIFNIEIVTGGDTDYYGKVALWTDELNSVTVENADDLYNVLMAKPDGSFKLTSDIDLGGKTVVGGIVFAGTLDGQGYALKNFKIADSAKEYGNGSHLFYKNTGTIKNVRFEYEFTQLNGTNGLINMNAENAVVENVLALVEYSVSEGKYKDAKGGALVEVNQDNATVKNCVIVISGSTVTPANIGAVCRGAIGSSVIKNCYVVTNGVVTDNSGKTPTLPYVTGEVDGSPVVEKVGIFASENDLIQGITGLSSADGWSALWKFTAKESISFNGKKVVQYQCDNHKDDVAPWLVCDNCNYELPECLGHMDKDTDYKCDKCGDFVVEADSCDHALVTDAQCQKCGAIMLTAENAGTPELFAALLNGNIYGDFVLTVDLDWGGALFGNTYGDHSSVSLIPDFYGTIDGKGHSIVNFRLGHSDPKEDYKSAIIARNHGTIKNIGFKYVYETANTWESGLIHTNNGTLDNIYVNAKIYAATTMTGVLVGVNTGAIKNCLTVIDAESTPTSDKALAGIVGSNQKGTITNCFTISNGHTTTNSAYTDQHPESEKPVFTCYETLADMTAEVTSFASADGWKSYWKLDTATNSLKFGEIVIYCEHKGVSCEQTCGACGVTIEHADEDPLDLICDKCGKSFITPENCPGHVNEAGDDSLCDKCGAIMLTQDNAGTPEKFAELISANPSKVFVLTSDLDFGGAVIVGNGIASFSGTLDGQGHVIKNFINEIFDATGEGAWESSKLINENSGTIKNIGFVYTIVAANSHFVAIVGQNNATGVVENVFVDLTIDTEHGGYIAPIVGINTGGATIKNCIVNITKTESSQMPTNSVGAIVATDRNGVIENCYAVYNGNISNPENFFSESGDSFGAASVTNYKAYATLTSMIAEITTLEGADGWSDAWSINADGLGFGSVSIAPKKEFTVTLPQSPNFTVTGEAIAIEGTSYVFTVTAAEGYEIVSVKNGDTVLTGMGDTYTVSSVDADIVITVEVRENVTIELNQTNAGTPADFAALISANPSSTFVLKSDLDWGGAAIVGNGIVSFSGTLDGQGHVIKNFKNGLYDAGNGNWQSSALFTENSGTIKNVGFVCTLEANNMANSTVLVGTNNGMISNVFVNLTLNPAQGSTVGTLVGILAGGATVENCIINLEIADGKTLAATQIGTVASTDRNATVKDCYVIHNGLVSDPTKHFSQAAGSFGAASVTNYKPYETLAAMLAEVTTLGSADGWATYWSIASDKIGFGSASLTVPVPPQEFNVTLPTGTNFTVTGANKAIEGASYTFTVTPASGYEIVSVKNGATVLTGNGGSYTVENVSADIVITVEVQEKAIVAPTVPTGYTEINMTNAGTLADFIALLNATPAGNFALTEDLDFGGEISGAVVQNFTGTLDGQGHKISNFEIKYGANAGTGATGAGNYISVLFETNGGTIKDVAFDYTLGTANSSYVGLIERNDGTIENVFVNVNFKAYQWTTGAIAAINGGSGTINNCVTVLNTTLTDQAAKNRLGSIVGVDYNGKILNCYSIVNGIHELTTPYVDTWGNGTYTGSENYADMAALTAANPTLDTADGWSSYWSIVGGEVVFAPAS